MCLVHTWASRSGLCLCAAVPSMYNCALSQHSPAQQQYGKACRAHGHRDQRRAACCAQLLFSCFTLC